jgi:hypothetical protein
MSPAIQRTQSAVLATIVVLAAIIVPPTIIVLPPIGILTSFAPTAGGFQREICFKRMSDKIKYEKDTLKQEWFWRSNGMDVQYPVLSLSGCHHFCNWDGRWYFDVGQRLMTWLFPVVLLVGNMDVSPLDKWRYLEVFHLLGDPIDSMWSLLAKVEAWSFCLFLAKRNFGLFLGLTERQLGTILAAIEEIIGPKGNPLLCLTEIVFPGNASQEEADSKQPISTKILTLSSNQSYKMSNQSGQGIRAVVIESTDQEDEGTNAPEEARLISAAPLSLSPNMIKILKDAAYEIADSRTDDIIRTAFAVCLYILQLVSAFVTVMGGGNSSPPGGRIGTAMLLTWLIPAIMLSNSVGGFTSRRSCFRSIRKMGKNIRAEQKRKRLHLRLQQIQEQLRLQRQVGEKQEQLQKELQELMQCLLKPDGEAQNAPARETMLEINIGDENAFFRDQRWSGGSDVYRPEKSHRFDTRSKKYTRTMLALSISPIFVSFIFGSAIIGKTPPYGFNCRSVALLGITFAWLFSALSTHLTWKLGLTERRRWYLVFWKDVAVAVPSVLLVFLSSAGLFNTCDCWSFKISKHQDAHVPLNVTSEFEQLDGKIYPILVALCLFLQFALFLAMRVVGRPGFKLMRWPERKKQMEFLSDPPHSLRYRIWQFLKRVGRITRAFS